MFPAAGRAAYARCSGAGRIGFIHGEFDFGSLSVLASSLASLSPAF
jgi:hypothetical protein